MLEHWAEMGFWTTGLKLQVLLIHANWMVPTLVKIVLNHHVRRK
jgi:hypothetical protein